MESKPTKFIDLSIRGQIFRVQRKLLSKYPDTALEAMFSGRHPPNLVDGYPFIDRDPQIFHHFLYYLKNDLKEPQCASLKE